MPMISFLALLKPRDLVLTFAGASCPAISVSISSFPPVGRGEWRANGARQRPT